MEQARRMVVSASWAVSRVSSWKGRPRRWVEIDKEGNRMGQQTSLQLASKMEDP